MDRIVWRKVETKENAEREHTAKSSRKGDISNPQPATPRGASWHVGTRVSRKDLAPDLSGRQIFEDFWHFHGQANFESNFRKSRPGPNGAGAQPFMQRLQSFGPVRGLAAGQYGEVSPDVHSLVAVCAESIASRRWRELGARSAKEACGFVTAAVKRRLGLVLVREMARFRLRRVPAIGVPNAALSGQADLQRRLRRRRGVDEPLDRPPAFVPEEFFAFQAFAAPRDA